VRGLSCPVSKGKCGAYVCFCTQVVFFEGSYSEYAADLRRRNGNVDPSRIKYRKMVLS